MTQGYEDGLTRTPGRTRPISRHAATMEGDRRAQLAAEQERTLGQIESLRASFEDVVAASEQVATDDEHDPEGHTIAWERQQLAALLSAAEARLGELQLAMRRIDEGAYGRCVRCRRRIPDDRLDALPTTTTCVTCAAP